MDRDQVRARRERALNLEFDEGGYNRREDVATA